MNGNELFNIQKGDFTSFTAIIFGKTREITKTLRDFLHVNGIYIKKSRHIIADELFEMLQRKEPEIQPINEKDRPSWLTTQPSIQLPTQPLTQLSTQLPTQPLTQETRLQNNLINLSKLYTDKQKYSGDSDNFEFKYSILLDLCKRAEVPKDAYPKAFPTMLKGTTLNYYYMDCKSNPYITSLSDLCNNIKQHFKRTEHERNVLVKQNDLTLRKEIDKNPGKSIEDCLQLLIQKLRVLQLGLEKDLHHEKFFLNKLLTACQDHPTCSIACSKPANTVNGLISDLQSSITTYTKVQGNNSQNQYFTDRQYHSNPRQSGYQNHYRYQSHQKNNHN